MNIGNKIQELRKKNSLSQEELAELVGVARQTISKWELNETSPDLKQAKKLSEIFKVSLDELVENNIQNILVEKVSNTEKLAGLILKIIKIVLIGVPILFVLLLLLSILYKNINKYNGRLIDETIYCKIYGEEHSYNIQYEELTSRPKGEGGDAYFYDILDLGKYNDAHQIFNVINDYVKKNGGSCITVRDHNLNDSVTMYIEEGSLTKTSMNVVITEVTDYDISYGETFWIEKYNYQTSSFEKLNEIGNNCGFNLPSYSVKDKPLVLKQDWSCMYGELDKGLYRLVKDVSFESDIPINSDDIYYISVEFEIE